MYEIRSTAPTWHPALDSQYNPSGQGGRNGCTDHLLAVTNSSTELVMPAAKCSSPRPVMIKSKTAVIVSVLIAGSLVAGIAKIQSYNSDCQETVFNKIAGWFSGWFSRSDKPGGWSQNALSKSTGK